MTRGALSTSVACLVTLAAIHGARADVVVPTPAADTTLSETSPDNNSGANANFGAGGSGRLTRNRALLRFDLAGQLPPTAIVLSVTLSLTVVNVPGDHAFGRRGGQIGRGRLRE